MKKNITIRKGLAVLLIMVFAISATPKAFFHDLVANHKDLPECNQVHKTAVLHHGSYNCHFDDLVVSGPFLSTIDQPLIFTAIHFEKKEATFCFFLLPSFLQHKENRGPPTV